MNIFSPDFLFSKSQNVLVRHKLQSPGQKGTSTEELTPSDCPVAMVSE